jgi:hypothetical protein
VRTAARKLPGSIITRDLRFSVIGQLLAAPSAKCEIRPEIKALSARAWRHPTTGEPIHFGSSVSGHRLATTRCADSLRRTLDRRRRVMARQSAGAERAEAGLHDREVRSYGGRILNGVNDRPTRAHVEPVPVFG